MATVKLTGDELTEAINSGRPFEIQGYTLTQNYQDKLQFALRLCLEQNEKQDLFPVVFSVIQELTLWSSLAVMRHIYFEERNLDLNDPEILEKHEADFQKSVNQANIQGYRRKARARSLYLNTRVVHNQAGLRVEVITNATHSRTLEEKLRRLLRQAMGYKDVMEYFADNPQDQDGRGLGLAFSILMLKEEKLRPELLRLGQSGEVMTSRLEIPFDTSFQSIRDRILNDEEVLPFENKNLVPEGIEPAVETDKTTCPICNQEISLQVFFNVVPPGMMDEDLVRSIIDGWDNEMGACASCIAIYSEEE